MKKINLRELCSVGKPWGSGLPIFNHVAMGNGQELLNTLVAIFTKTVWKTLVKSGTNKKRLKDVIKMYTKNGKQTSSRVGRVNRYTTLLCLSQTCEYKPTSRCIGNYVTGCNKCVGNGKKLGLVDASHVWNVCAVWWCCNDTQPNDIHLTFSNYTPDITWIITYSEYDGECKDRCLMTKLCVWPSYL